MQKERLLSNVLKTSTLLLLTGIFFTACINRGQKSKLGYQDINIQDCDFTYLKAKSKVSYSDAEHSVNATMNVRIKKDSAIWVSVSIMAEAIRLVVRPDSVFFYQKLPHKDYNEYSIKELSKLAGVAIDFQMLQSIFLGNMMVYNQNNLSIEQSDISFTTKEEFTNFIVSNLIDRKTNKVSEITISEKDSETSSTINFTEIKDYEVCSIPSKINFVSNISITPDSSISNQVGIKYSKVKFLDEGLSFPFKKRNK